ncbi:MAG: type II CRISPR RNA-guided endonuclease Cas9 [Phycisphaeraceae bacterium]
MLDYTLGLDLGAASVGWAVVKEPTTDQDTDSVLHLGVHRFEAGVADPGKMGYGKEESSAKPRRDARQMRRQLWRRKRRRHLLLKRLQEHGLLPVGDITTPEATHDFLRAIDQMILDRRYAQATHKQMLKLPYLMRAKAVSERIELDELGRVLYHLAHRRGYLSNRKTEEVEKDEDKQDKKKKTKFKQDMADLADRVARHDPPYLGAYLASLNPDEQRLRGQRTSRQVYLDEFEAIWTEQTKHHPDTLNEEVYKSLHRSIFYQRPLRSQRHLRGKCSLTGKTRAPIALRIIQRFRAIQKLNDLQIIYSDGTKRGLNPDERARVLELQMTKGDVAFSTLKQKKHLALPRDATFNLAEIDKKLIGHRTDAKLRKALGDRFDELSEDNRDAIVQDLRSYRDTGKLAERLETAYDLPPDVAGELSKVKLESDRAAHATRAIRELLPLMEQGTAYATARKEKFPEALAGNTKTYDHLPPVEAWLKDHERAVAIRNPAVMRGLTEVRKVVNAIIRRYGKPKTIRIELARDLKNSKKRREQISKDIEARRKSRAKAAELLVKEYGVADPRHSDIEKVLLLWECKGRCPYTNKEIEPARDLFGPNPAFQVEHIWPLSASMDDSYVNKTLCHVDENQRKGGRSPIDCYDQDKLDEIKRRIEKFDCDPRTRAAKLRRFTEPIPDDFVNRHLNDSRYLATEAKKYLGCLFGPEESEDPNATRIWVVTGGLTSMMRGLWGLNTLAGGPANEKERIDHRHHAIDALVVALTRQAHTHKLMSAAARAERQHLQRNFLDVAHPWADFYDQAKAAVDKIVVSYRPDRKLRGKLHQDTLYSEKTHGTRRVRRELHTLKATEVNKIIDPRIAHAVREKLKALSQSDPAKAFADQANLPTFKDKRGRTTRIRKARITVSAKPTRIGKGATERHVNLGSNHHTVISEDNKGKWHENTVSLIEAMRRKAAGEPVIQTPTGHQFLYSLVQNDHVEIEEEGRNRVLRVANLSSGDIELVDHNDGRPAKERGKDRVRLKSNKKWTELKPRKVTVTHLGEVKDAGG